ncbi:MAG: C40 family peptidase [Duncaniella sp.]|nr:C40 family peptidase [Duncaniella sp.]
MQRYILSTILLIATTITAIAKHPDGEMRIPAAHATAAGALSQATPFMSDALANARLNSPFLNTPSLPSSLKADAKVDALIDDIKNFAAGFLGTRYRLGASGPSRFDCSGFTSYIFKNFGFSLNRDSRSQFTQGEKVNKDELRPGDLVFFSSRSSGKNRVGHVGMITDVHPDGSYTFIHASTKHGVVYQRFPDGAYYSRHFLGAKRIIGTAEFGAL